MIERGFELAVAGVRPGELDPPVVRALFQMLGVFSEFERAIIQERVRAGIARARAEGKHLGRPRINGETERGIRAALAEGGVNGSAAADDPRPSCKRQAGAPELRLPSI